MKRARWISAAAGMAMLAGTLALPGAGVAYAAGPGNGNVTGVGNLSLGSGNTVTAPVSAPINLCGISAAILGFANSGCVGGASAVTNLLSPPAGSTGGNGNVTGNGNLSLGSGNTVTAPVSVPVNICGISGAVGGYANSDCKGGSHSTTVIQSGPSGTGSGNGNVTGVGNGQVLSGNTITAPVTVPVNLCGISVALLGYANSACVGGATSDVTLVPSGSNGNVTGVGNGSVLSGNTITAPITAPVNICGVSLAVLGFSNAECHGGATVNTPPCTGKNCTPPCTGKNCTPPCTGNNCTPPCTGKNCTPPCTGKNCTPPCTGKNCTPPCHGDSCPPCQGNGCTPPCHGKNCPPCTGNSCCNHNGCTPPCTGSNCTPPCTGKNCTPPCTGSSCSPPSCQGSGCTPPGGHGHGTPPSGLGTGSTTSSLTGALPTTGANLLALVVVALGSIGVGTGTVVLARRRRSGEAA
jgi:hypothetical protein